MPTRSFAVADGKLAVTMLDGKHDRSAKGKQFAGYLGEKCAEQFLLRNNGLGSRC
jgi:hypothetical protein